MATKIELMQCSLIISQRMFKSFTTKPINRICQAKPPGFYILSKHIKLKVLHAFNFLQTRQPLINTSCLQKSIKCSITEPFYQSRVVILKRILDFNLLIIYVVLVATILTATIQINFMILFKTKSKKFDIFYGLWYII